MNRKLISKAISDIDDAFIEESMPAPVIHAAHTPERTSNMDKYEKRNHRAGGRRLAALAVVACLVFSLAMTAYALNLFGIREMFRTPYRELPEAAEPYIQQHKETAAAEDWSAKITESLCDTGKIMTTVTVSGGDKYIVAPIDAMPDNTVSCIGLQGDQTLDEYAAAQGKELLFVGATLRQNQELGIFMESQITAHVSDSEMNILLESTRSGGVDGGDAICMVYAHDEEGNQLRLDVPFALSPVPVEDVRIYVPVDSDAIPGLTVGEATVKETPLGLSVRWMETITDQEAFMRVEIEGVTYQEGGSILEADGNYYFQILMGEGTIGDTMTVHFYDQDDHLIGNIVFQKNG